MSTNFKQCFHTKQEINGVRNYIKHCVLNLLPFKLTIFNQNLVSGFGKLSFVIDYHNERVGAN